MAVSIVLGLVFLVVGILFIGTKVEQAEQEKVAQMSPAERSQYREAKLDAQLAFEWGPVNPSMICPHCQEKGKTRTKHVVQKKGISGGKAAAALVTGGLSVLATGLSRKEGLTQAHCDACQNTWSY